ncbi:hypothetical protein DYE49_06020 [Treponema rectale]|uniref:Lipoprotein n=1 Tax=Treponema rectale TaxID=744512 RepID=A0A840SE95_9SPIR|nr:hypothetical protein [Treponema rectale]MBB5218266.1 hypothetical protein [Treponema rectale]QOS40031.1 hypothetical protein DYE49_06020 [Treponema rectale]
MKKAVKIFAVLSAAAGLAFSSCSTDSGSSPKNESILEKDELDGKVLKRENHLTDATYGGYTVIQSYVFNDGECEYTKEQKGDEGSQI